MKYETNASYASSWVKVHRIRLLVEFKRELVPANPRKWIIGQESSNEEREKFLRC